MEEKLRNAFQVAFEIGPDQFSEDLSPDGIPGWDSLGHLRLVNALQEQFGFEFEVEEIMAMENLAAIRSVLQARGVAA